jgi:hypothetical protein
MATERHQKTQNKHQAPNTFPKHQAPNTFPKHQTPNTFPKHQTPNTKLQKNIKLQTAKKHQAQLPNVSRG